MYKQYARTKINRSGSIDIDALKYNACNMIKCREFKVKTNLEAQKQLTKNNMD